MAGQKKGKRPRKPRQITDHLDKLCKDVDQILGFNPEVDKIALELLTKVADWYPIKGEKAILERAKFEAFKRRADGDVLEYNRTVAHHRGAHQTEPEYAGSWDDAIRTIEDHGVED